MKSINAANHWITLMKMLSDSNSLILPLRVLHLSLNLSRLGRLRKNRHCRLCRQHPALPNFLAEISAAESSLLQYKKRTKTSFSPFPLQGGPPHHPNPLHQPLHRGHHHHPVPVSPRPASHHRLMLLYPRITLRGASQAHRTGFSEVLSARKHRKLRMVS